MSPTDGTVVGTTQIVNNGPASLRWNLVLVGDGYRSSELAQYATNAQSFVDYLFGTPPFNDLYLFGQRLSDAINVYRVDVSSTDSGADDPTPCGGTGAMPATYFDASFCNGGVQRLLVVNTTTVASVVSAQVPQAHQALVLVNSPIYGGGGGPAPTFSMAFGANEIGLHELGHSAFGLADEYEYWAGCGADVGHDNHPTSEPTEPNVTINSDRATIKWHSLIAATTPMPTTANANCAVCDPQSSPVMAGTVGAFEGAHYYHCGAYRPEFSCRMRALSNPFCAVCKSRIRSTLEPYLPPVHLPEIADILNRIRLRDWIADPAPIDLLRLVEVIRKGGRPDAGMVTDDLTQLLGQIDTMNPAQLRTMLLRVRSNQVRLAAAAEMIDARLGKGQR
jgi:IgA Peptidase M64